MEKFKFIQAYLLRNTGRVRFIKAYLLLNLENARLIRGYLLLNTEKGRFIFINKVNTQIIQESRVSFYPFLQNLIKKEEIVHFI